jgi:putative long chain acyl-CoA synthase
MASSRRIRKLRSRIEVMGVSARNALELLGRGRLGAPYRAAYEEVGVFGVGRLRRYGAADEPPPSIAQPALLIPPLMVTAEVYDISPELSGVAALRARGLDVWLLDFGAPEEEAGGMERTLDDHILSVVRAVEAVSERTGQPVHLLGYSQGGLFVYQAAAYLRAKHCASLITFGSPVDIRRALPVPMHDALAERLLRAASGAVAGPLQEIEGLPGLLTSSGFKLLNARKEVRQIVDALGMLHDRGALERREPKRRFLGGEGFVAWPGPALREFIDEMVANNRLAKGGLVVGSRPISMSDITCPILYFVGARDDLARPGSVRAIQRIAPRAELFEYEVECGHFGLVVGSRAVEEVWPTVADWVAWRAGSGAEPAFLRPDEEPRVALTRPSGSIAALYDLATDALDGAWERLGERAMEAASVLDSVRWQLPRLARLDRLEDDTRCGLAATLFEQARHNPEQQFLLWSGRAWSVGAAAARVTRLAHVLSGRGVRAGACVALELEDHPDVLTTLAACNLLGACALVLHPATGEEASRRMLSQLGVRVLVADVGSAARVAGWVPEVLVWRGGLDEAVEAAPAGELPVWARHEPRGADRAFILPTRGDAPRYAPMSNRRWTLAALGFAAACRLTASDTVYSIHSMRHAFGGALVAGGALAGGARLALGSRARDAMAANELWEEVRRYGATVLPYDGQLVDALLAAEAVPEERRHPLRMCMGHAMTAARWAAWRARVGDVQVLEFWTSTEGNACLANLTGEKPGALGRPLPGLENVELVRMQGGALARDAGGRLVRCEAGEHGAAVARIDATRPLWRFEGLLDPEEEAARVVEDGFEEGDRWLVLGDVMWRDGDGDYWLVGRMG